jgi:hypothetical protein
MAHSPMAHSPMAHSPMAQPAMAHSPMAHSPMAQPLMAHSPMAQPLMAHSPMAQPAMAHSPMAHSPMAHSPMAQPTSLIDPTPFDSMEDYEIRNIANHLNDNLKMLLYLVDADKLKKVQNILFGKSSRKTHSRKTHMTRKQHSHHLNATIPRRYQQSPEAILGVQDVMIPKSAYATAPFPLPLLAPAPAAAFIPSYQKIKKIHPYKLTRKLTRKHMLRNETPSHLEESSHLEEVMNE